MSPTPEGRVLFFEVLRKNARKLIPAFVGLGAVIAGFLFLFVGFGSSSSSTVALAADRSSDQTANRGSGRGTLESPSVVGAGTAETSTTETTVVEPTTTEAPTTTTTAVPVTAAPLTTPPTTAAPKPKVTTTTAAPVTTVAPAAPAPAAAPVAVASDADAVWVRLAKCESGNRNDTGAPYYGYFQFSAATWTSVGGSGLPSDNSYEIQLEMAKKLQARSGWGQWPVCSKVALAG